MSFSHRHSRGLNDGTVSISYDKAVVAGLRVELSESIAAGVADLLIEAGIPVTNLKSLFIAADQDLTLETNNPGGTSGSPDQTFALKANQPIDWTENDPEACPLTTAVTALYASNAGDTATVLEIRALYEATP